MGNCLSIKVDKERRVWTRKRRQRSNESREGMPFSSHGTAYQDSFPKPTLKRRRRRKEEHFDQLPFYYAVSPPSPGLGPSPYPMPVQSTQPMPVQEAPVQHLAVPQPPMQQPWTQQPAPQPTTGMDPGLVRTMMQGT